jgi:acetyl-CoA acyltransferase
VLEVARQMRGECGGYQLRGTLRHGIAANMGGDDRTAVVTVLRNNAAG